MDALTAKILAMVLLGGISMALGILPVFLRRFCNFGGTTTGPRGQFFLSALSCFGGGVILTTCFTHMLPEVNFFLENNIKNGHFPETGKKRSLINSTKISQSMEIVLCWLFFSSQQTQPTVCFFWAKPGPFHLFYLLNFVPKLH